MTAYDATEKLVAVLTLPVSHQAPDNYTANWPLTF